MNRFVSSGLILTVLMVVLLGRCHYNNVSVNLAMPIYDAVSVISHVKSQVDSHYYRTQKLPANNQEINQSAPDKFGRKSALLQRVEVFPEGIVFVQFTAQNHSQPVELVYTPAIESQYRLNWTCSSYNLTQQWREALQEICSDTNAPFDANFFAQKKQQEKEANHYIEKISSRQREIKTTQTTFDCTPIEQADDDFLHVTDHQVDYWELSDAPIYRFSFPRPELGHQTVHWALAGDAYVYADGRLRLYNNEIPEGESTQINLMNPYRLQRSDDKLLANSGIGLTRIDLCQTQPKVHDNYLLELGAFNQIEDFAILNDLVFLTALEANRGKTFSALQIVSLRSNRPIGFLKLEGSSRGIALNGRIAYIANGTYGIALVDIYDLTVPRLLSRVTTMDYASDLIIRDEHLIVADRLAGLKVYRLADK